MCDAFQILCVEIFNVHIIFCEKENPLLQQAQAR